MWCLRFWFIITMTSQWAWWRLRSPASRLFTQPFIRAQIKENFKAPRHWPLCGEFTGTGEFPAQKASNAENVSIWWRHHGKFANTIMMWLVASKYVSNLSAEILEKNTSSFLCNPIHPQNHIWKNRVIRWRSNAATVFLTTRCLIRII